jgi:hypothetical protein
MKTPAQLAFDPGHNEVDTYCRDNQRHHIDHVDPRSAEQAIASTRLSIRSRRRVAPCRLAGCLEEFWQLERQGNAPANPQGTNRIRTLIQSLR